MFAKHKKRKWPIVFVILLLLLSLLAGLFVWFSRSLTLTLKVQGNQILKTEYAPACAAECWAMAQRTLSPDDSIPTQPETVIPEGKVIYLTFDDGPGKYTEKLLGILQKYDVKATFFVVNTSYTHLLPDIAAQGHTIGVHTGSHIYREIYASEEAFFRDFKEMHDDILQRTGVSTTLMRFPGGSSNRVSSFNPGIMTRLTKLVTEYGLQYFDWNVDSMDATYAKTTKEIFENVISGVQKQPCSVVLQHDLFEASVDAVELIIQWGLENGYRFLPLEPSSPTYHQPICN